MSPDCNINVHVWVWVSHFFKLTNPWCTGYLMPLMSMAAWNVVGTFQGTKASIRAWATALAPAASRLVGNGGVHWKDGAMHRARVNKVYEKIQCFVYKWVCRAFSCSNYRCFPSYSQIRLSIIYLCTCYIVGVFFLFSIALIFQESDECQWICFILWPSRC